MNAHVNPPQAPQAPQAPARKPRISQRAFIGWLFLAILALGMAMGPKPGSPEYRRQAAEEAAQDRAIDAMVHDDTVRDCINGTAPWYMPRLAWDQVCRRTLSGVEP